MEEPIHQQASRSDGESYPDAEHSYDGSIRTEKAAQLSFKLKHKLASFKDIRKNKHSNNKTIVRSNKVIEAMDLPTIINLNPRSVYNKIDEFHALVEEEDVDIVFMSESWERENKTLHEIINLEDHIIISNVNQRKEVGGRPALIVKSNNYLVQDLTNSVIQIPWVVEVVWALITPKNVQNDSKIQRIILGSIYSKPNSKMKKSYSRSYNRCVQPHEYQIQERAPLDPCR